MKIAGWICTILGVISLLGAIVAGDNPLGPTFWLALGIFLLYKANKNDNK
ncbi:MAG TPA: hypothetical protein PLP97_07250 [Prevotella sp.]|nr:hypothetical protein [Prevotella sp.]